MDVIMLVVGGVVMYAGMAALTEYYVGTGMSRSAAQQPRCKARTASRPPSSCSAVLPAPC